MFRTATKKTLVSWVSAASLVSSLVVLPAGLARAGFTGGGPAQMLSQGPCLYSLQLQKSVTERRRYLVALSAATGEQPSPVEAMYADVKQASYSSDGPSDDDPWGLGAKQPMAAPGLDSFSTDCLSCHDGASALSIGANVKNDPFKRGRHSKYSGTDHPVGMDYQSYVSANQGKYKPVFGLGTKMVFVNGKVGCLTCHDPLNPERKHLVMSDRKSALCLTCHDK